MRAIWGWDFLTVHIFWIPSELIHMAWRKSQFSLLETPPFWWLPRTRMKLCCVLCLCPTAGRVAVPSWVGPGWLGTGETPGRAVRATPTPGQPLELLLHTLSRCHPFEVGFYISSRISPWPHSCVGVPGLERGLVTALLSEGLIFAKYFCIL